MELIAQKPIYLGGGNRVLPGERFSVPSPAIANDFVSSGRASFAAYAAPVSTTQAGLVSCIMPTKNRREFIPRAIACFLAQTYPLKELVILDNGEPIADLVPKDDRIRYMRLNSMQPTGQLRNFCCQMAKGEFIAHWDDDDWSHPLRLEEQVAAIGEKQATGYNSILFDGPQSEVYVYAGAKNYALGTSLLYRRSWWEQSKFAALKVGEDNDFVKKATPFMSFADGTGRIVARTHATNTSPRQTKTAEWKKASACALPEGYTR
jgi:antitoxin (DNA-binding transcriptional repressor) of toxin-antitoxin stability system